jgi:hypothetical protein
MFVENPLYERHELPLLATNGIFTLLSLNLGLPQR